MKEKILVINDEEGIREITHSILAEQGYEFCEAANGREGISQAIQEHPDLILLDIMMPEMNGYETCEALKSNPAIKDIPVIFLSSLTTPSDKIRGLELGAVDFIHNAFDPGELLARVQTHLKIKALTHALSASNQELLKKQKSLDDDLHAAAVIQRSFLPSSALSLGNIQLASLWLPVHALGGDIFNVMQHGTENIIVYMIDVSGHDVPSALVTISISQYLHQQNQAPVLLPPKEIVRNLNREYPLERFNRYFTVFYFILNTKKGKLTYSCGGHPPAILCKRSAGVKILDRGGTIIGLDGELPLEEWSEMLEEGDKLFLYTDGIMEVKNQREQFFGIDRLCTLLEKKKNHPIDEMISSVHKSLLDFSEGEPIQDDISIIGLEFRP